MWKISWEVALVELRCLLYRCAAFVCRNLPPTYCCLVVMWVFAIGVLHIFVIPAPHASRLYRVSTRFLCSQWLSKNGGSNQFPIMVAKKKGKGARQESGSTEKIWTTTVVNLDLFSLKACFFYGFLVPMDRSALFTTSIGRMSFKEQPFLPSIGILSKSKERTCVTCEVRRKNGFPKPPRTMPVFPQEIKS